MMDGVVMRVLKRIAASAAEARWVAGLSPMMPALEYKHNMAVLLPRIKPHGCDFQQQIELVFVVVFFGLYIKAIKGKF